MPITRILLLLAALSLGFVAGLAIEARTSRQAPSQTPEQSSPSLSPEERTRLLAQGKELFMARCASCHDEHGDKPLKTGPPLNERGLSSEKIARLVDGRLRQKTEEERRAVTLYISSLMKTKAPADELPAKP